MELSKTYDPSSVESTAYQTWLDEGAFTADPARPGPSYSIVIPPPNVTGALCDWTRTRFTLDDMCARAVRETFFKLFKDGLIYRGKRLVNWDTHLQTSISDDELYVETVKTNLWHIRYPIDGTDKSMTIAT